MSNATKIGQARRDRSPEIAAALRAEWRMIASVKIEARRRAALDECVQRVNRHLLAT